MSSFGYHYVFYPSAYFGRRGIVVTLRLSVCLSVRLSVRQIFLSEQYLKKYWTDFFHIGNMGHLGKNLGEVRYSDMQLINLCA